MTILTFFEYFSNGENDPKRILFLNGIVDPEILLRAFTLDSNDSIDWFQFCVLSQGREVRVFEFEL